MPPTDAARDWPTYWFTRLEDALHRGDFDNAADAARQLRRLGVAVTYPRPTFDTSPARVKAVDRG